MRISDWSSDVCSSDLPEDSGDRPCAPVADTAQAPEDVDAAIAFIRNETGAPSIDLVGWSWGATIAAACAAGGGAVNRLVLHAPQWLRDTPSPLVTPQTMAEPYRTEIGRASGRERVCPYVEISVGAGSLKKKKDIHNTQETQT